MRDRKLIPNTIRAKKKSNNMLFLKTEVKKRSSSLDLTKPSKDICKSKEGYVRSQVKSLSCQTITESPLPSPPHTRRNSSEALTKREEPKLLPTPPIPVATPSKSTPTSEQINSNNRKTSLKKMGACAIAVQNEDGTQSVYVCLRTSVQSLFLFISFLYVGSRKKHWQRTVWWSIWWPKHGYGWICGY